MHSCASIARIACVVQACGAKAHVQLTGPSTRALNALHLDPKPNGVRPNQNNIARAGVKATVTTSTVSLAQTQNAMKVRCAFLSSSQPPSNQPMYARAGVVYGVLPSLAASPPSSQPMYASPIFLPVHTVHWVQTLKSLLSILSP
jgi:hypothetical protein